jgi:hypothetical protein
VAFWALLALIVIAQANPILKLPGRDNGTYLYLGDQILSGKIPYKDAWESKPPAIFYVNALGLWIGRGSRLGVWLVEFFTVFLAAFLGYSVLRRLWGNQAAIFGSLIWIYGLNRTLERGNLTEEYSLPFSFMALLIFLHAVEKPKLRLPDTMIGVLFAVNFMFRPDNAITSAAIVMTLILMCLIRYDFRLLIYRLGAMAIGALAVVLVPVFYFWQKNVLLEFYNATIGFNITYSNTPIVANVNPLRDGLWYLGASSWIALIGFLLACALLIVSIRKDKTIPPINLLIILGLVTVVPLTDPASRSYAHYYMTWLPLIAVSSGYCYSLFQSKLSAAIALFRDNAVRDNLMALFLTILIFVMSGVGGNYLRAIDRVLADEDLKFGRRSIISRYVNNHTAPSELVFFWGGFPGENFMSRRDSPTPYLYYPLYLESSLSDEINKAFLNDLLSHHPVLIVDMGYQRALSFDPATRTAQLASGVELPHLPKNLYTVYDFIEENYFLEATVDGKKVYRLHGTDVENND